MSTVYVRRIVDPQPPRISGLQVEQLPLLDNLHILLHVPHQPPLALPQIGVPPHHGIVGQPNHVIIADRPALLPRDLLQGPALGASDIVRELVQDRLRTAADHRQPLQIEVLVFLEGRVFGQHHHPEGGVVGLVPANPVALLLVPLLADQYCLAPLDLGLGGGWVWNPHHCELFGQVVGDLLAVFLKGRAWEVHEDRLWLDHFLPLELFYYLLDPSFLQVVLHLAGQLRHVLSDH